MKHSMLFGPRDIYIINEVHTLGNCKVKILSHQQSSFFQDTTDYISAVSTSYSSNTNFINSVKGYHHSPPPLSHSGQFISDDNEKASRFNQYFNSVFTNTNIKSLHDSIYFHPKLINTITLHQPMFTRNLLICRAFRLLNCIELCISMLNYLRITEINVVTSSGHLIVIFKHTKLKSCLGWTQ